MRQLCRRSWKLIFQNSQSARNLLKFIGDSMGFHEAPVFEVADVIIEIVVATFPEPLLHLLLEHLELEELNHGGIADRV